MNKDFWKGRRVLVTGSSGFVGTWMVKRLNGMGAVAYTFDIKDSLWSDVNNSESLRTIFRNVITTVIHLAAQSQVGHANQNPTQTFLDNIRGTWNLLETCREFPAIEQIIIASSDKAYSESPILPYTENTPLRGVYPYDCSKACADLISQCYAKTFNLPIAIARCGNIYGGGDMNWNRIVPGTIRSVLNGENPVIRSDGTPIRDYFYVEDAVEAYLTLVEKLADGIIKPGEAFNFSNDEPLSTMQMAVIVMNTMDKTDDHVGNFLSQRPFDIRNEATNEIQAQHLSSAKARSVLGWEPRYNLVEGLKKTVAWYREHLKESGH